MTPDSRLIGSIHPNDARIRQVSSAVRFHRTTDPGATVDPGGFDALNGSLIIGRLFQPGMKACRMGFRSSTIPVRAVPSRDGRYATPVRPLGWFGQGRGGTAEGGVPRRMARLGRASLFESGGRAHG